MPDTHESHETPVAPHPPPQEIIMCPWAIRTITKMFQATACAMNDIYWCENLILWRGIVVLISCIYSHFIPYRSFAYYVFSQLNLHSNSFLY